MKNILVGIGVIFFCAATITNAKSDTTTFVSCAEQEYKNGFCVTYGKDANLPHYNAEAVVFMGNYIENRKEGFWKHYFPDGTLKSEVEFKNNRPNGYAKFYNDKGIIIEEGFWKTRKWTGKYISRHDNGEVKYEWNYGERGLREGTQKYYHPNGKIMYEGEFNSGKETGIHLRYDETGQLTEKKEYNNGQLVDFNATIPPDKQKKPTPPAPPVDTIGITLDTTHTGDNLAASNPGLLHGYYKDYDRRTQQLRREGYFENGVFKDGWIYKYETVDKESCETKIKIVNYKRVKQAECEDGEGEKKKNNK